MISTSLALTGAITGRSGILLIENLREGSHLSSLGVLRHFAEAGDHTVIWPVGALDISEKIKDRIIWGSVVSLPLHIGC